MRLLIVLPSIICVLLSGSHVGNDFRIRSGGDVLASFIKGKFPCLRATIAVLRELQFFLSEQWAGARHPVHQLVCVVKVMQRTARQFDRVLCERLSNKAVDRSDWYQW